MPDNAAVPILLTRPAPQSRAFADALAGRFGTAVAVTISPVMKIVPNRHTCLPEAETLILGSANAVGALRAAWDGTARAWCVGSRTVEAARAAGFELAGQAADAERLVARLTALPPQEFFHARGRHSRGDIAGRLQAAGHTVRQAVVYDQLACPLSALARNLLEGGSVVLLPLFSPRSAGLVAAEVPRPGPGARPICLSRAVRDALPPVLADRARVAADPTGAAMLEAIGAAISSIGAA